MGAGYEMAVEEYLAGPRHINPCPYHPERREGCWVLLQQHADAAEDDRGSEAYFVADFENGWTERIGRP
jgi:hypothetical protein